MDSSVKFDNEGRLMTKQESDRRAITVAASTERQGMGIPSKGKHYEKEFSSTDGMRTTTAGGPHDQALAMSQ